MDSPYVVPMSDSFGEQLKALIVAAGMNQDEFARKGGITSGSITNIIKGRRTPPPEKLDLWAEILGLHGKLRDRFMDLAMVAHLPREVQHRYILLLRRLERWESQHFPSGHS